MRGRAHGAVSHSRLALSFKPLPVPLDRESETEPCIKEGRQQARAPSASHPEASETGPFSFLVIIEIGSQVLLLSRGAQSALITRCHTDLRARTTHRSAA
ncbi:unnamed protein product, partial [Iphiclides podalirius]